MSKPKTILVVAGEESGDKHASVFVRKIKQQHPDWHFVGIGGSHLQQAGMELLFNLAQHGVTGFTEVVKQLPIIRRAFQSLKLYLAKHPVDLVILVDYPGFNLRFAKFIKQQLNTPILYYISPQIWAWKAKRIQVIQRYIDHMAVILPFEQHIYQQAGIKAHYVGNPLVDDLEVMDQSLARKELHLPADAEIVALLPGSRLNEIKRLMPVLIESIRLLIKQHPDMHFVLPIANTIPFAQIQELLPEDPLPLHLINQQAQTVLNAADYVVVASGTAALQTALLGKPGCIVYKTSALTALLVHQFIQCKYIGLPNIIDNRMLMPELLQEDCNAQSVFQCINELKLQPHYRSAMISAMQSLHNKLSKPNIIMDQLVYQVLQD